MNATTTEKLTCQRCHESWEPRKEDGPPLRCPRCGSKHWNRKRAADKILKAGEVKS